MTMNIETKKRFLINIAYWTVILVIVYVIFKYLIGLLLPFLLAFLVVSVLRPLVRYLNQRFKFKLAFSALVCDLLFFGALGIIIGFGGARIITMLIDVFARLPAFYTNVFEPAIQNLAAGAEGLAAQFDIPSIDWIDTFLPQLVNNLGDWVSRFSMTVVGFLSDYASRLPSILVNILMMIIATFFLSFDYENVTQFILNNLPERARRTVLAAGSNFKKTLLQYGKSYFIILCITFCELAAGLGILKVKNFAMAAVLISFVDVLPVLGTGIVLIPWALMSLLQKNYYQGIGLIILYVVILVVRQIMEPRIVGKQVGVHPLVTLISMFVGANLFGIIGMFGLPLSIAIIQNLTANGNILIFKKNKEPDNTDADSSDAK